MHGAARQRATDEMTECCTGRQATGSRSMDDIIPPVTVYFNPFPSVASRADENPQE